jgi:cytolysin (calcineurin-like family phosphatase)
MNKLIGSALISLLVLALASNHRAVARDVTFLATSDCHYDAFENEDRNGRDHETILCMNGVSDIAWPRNIGGGNIGKPRGVVVLGDCIDDGDRLMNGQNQSAPQYASFLGDFGFDGKAGALTYPVFETWGNHDGPPAGKEKNGFSFQKNLRERNLKRQSLGWLSSVSSNGMHISWNWDDVHFVLLGIYPADAQNTSVRYDPVWHNPQGALTFMKEDLARNVGQSGRPVVLASHCGFDTDWWKPEDWKAVHDAAKAYNVVLYMYGHSGTGSDEWAPPGETRRWATVNTGQTENGFFVVQITDKELRAAYRAKDIDLVKQPDGHSKRVWNGGWSWKYTKRISLAEPKP